MHPLIRFFHIQTILSIKVILHNCKINERLIDMKVKI